MGVASLARRDTSDHVGPIVDGLLAVERALLARESLADNPGGLGELQLIAGRRVAPPDPDIGRSYRTCNVDKVAIDNLG